MVHLLAPLFTQDHNRFIEPCEANFASAFVSDSMVPGTAITQKDSSSITRETCHGGIVIPFHIASIMLHTKNIKLFKS